MGTHGARMNLFIFSPLMPVPEMWCFHYDRSHEHNGTKVNTLGETVVVAKCENFRHICLACSQQIEL